MTTYNIITSPSPPESPNAETIYVIDTSNEVLVYDSTLNLVALDLGVESIETLKSAAEVTVVENFKALTPPPDYEPNSLVFVLSNLDSPYSFDGGMIYVYHYHLKRWFSLDELPIYEDADTYYIRETSEGQLVYKNTIVNTHWETVNW